jgi:hypothetical protein
VAGDAEMIQRADHRIFQPVHIFFDEVAHALQIQQRIGHHLTGAVIGHLAAAIGGHHGNIAGVQNIFGFAGQPLGECGECSQIQSSSRVPLRVRVNSCIATTVAS